jgi:hypothetical protein
METEKVAGLDWNRILMKVYTAITQAQYNR